MTTPHIVDLSREVFDPGDLGQLQPETPVIDRIDVLVVPTDTFDEPPANHRTGMVDHVVDQIPGSPVILAANPWRLDDHVVTVGIYFYDVGVDRTNCRMPVKKPTQPAQSVWQQEIVGIARHEGAAARQASDEVSGCTRAEVAAVALDSDVRPSRAP